MSVNKAMTTSNPAQWPSFENWSVRYAQYCLGRIRVWQASAILVQRAWRQRNFPRNQQHLYPICIQGRSISVRQGARAFREGNNDSLLSKYVEAHEKLDGTNLGIRCDGFVFGRRQKVEGSKYQKTSLDGILPTAECMEKIKLDFLNGEASSASATKLLLYGELMCNSGRYNYTSRELAKKWYVFGAVLQTENVDVDTARTILDALIDRDYWASLSPDSTKITVRLNKQLNSLVTRYGVQCVPHMASGSIRDVCVALQSKLMETDNLEGVVLSGSDVLIKWKTSKEDESKGHEMLANLVQDFSETTLDMCGVANDMVKLLLKVSARPESAPIRISGAEGKVKKVKPVKVSQYSEHDLESAYQSAASKYDDLSTYFEREARNDIIDLLSQEIEQDFNAKMPKQVACIRAFVKKKIGRAFGMWIQSKQ